MPANSFSSPTPKGEIGQPWTRRSFFRWPLFWPFAVASIPAAYVGGAITLPGTAYKVLVGLVLLYGWAGPKQTSAVAAPFILVNSVAALAAGLVSNPALPPDYAWWLMAVVLLGGWAGAEYGSRRFPNPLIRRVLAVVLAIAGGKMVLV